ncbi:MAG: hypothetical protein QF819_04945 [Gemmatimonadota bacterium]|nr:hypothetical protein [Gemmatimonadota bacterium]MDP7031770.1 hypothetical protein [Gemmatimonadota bacterium]
MVAFAGGAVRGWNLPAIGDSPFHLLRVGRDLLRGSLHGYATPPGGEGAPPAAALLVGMADQVAPTAEAALRLPGALALGGAAALAWTVLRKRVGIPPAIFGTAMLLLPPAIASSFSAHPGSAAAGVLVLAALARAARRGPDRTGALLASAAVLSAPAALPVAVASCALPGPCRRRALWIPAGVMAGIAALSLLLPAGSRLEIARAMLGGWSAPGPGFPTTVATLGGVWVWGSLLVAPFLVVTAVARRAIPAAFVIPPAVGAGVALLFSGPEAFAQASPVLLPAFTVLAALALHAVARAQAPAPDDSSDATHIPRAQVFALLLPFVLMVLTTPADRARRSAARAEGTRLAQIGARLRSDPGSGDGALLAARTGALSLFSGRRTFPLTPHTGRVFPVGLPKAPGVVVFREGIRPSLPAEHALFDNPSFLDRYAPLSFHRGPRRTKGDALWMLRRTPALPEATGVPADYRNALRRGWLAEARGERNAAREAFREAADAEPPGLGIAHEWVGVLEELRRDHDAAERAFQRARQDPATCRARGHLADRAISRGRLARADSLLSEATAFNPQEAKTWGVGARLLGEQGRLEEALAASERGILLRPVEPRMLANRGTLLWTAGLEGEARDFWARAARVDERIRRVLGRFEDAPSGAPPPPLLPLYTDAEFAPERASPVEE